MASTWKPSPELKRQIDLVRQKRFIDIRRQGQKTKLEVQGSHLAKGILRSGAFFCAVDDSMGRLATEHHMGDLKDMIRLIVEFSTLNADSGAWIRAEFDSAVEAERTHHRRHLEAAARDLAVRPESVEKRVAATLGGLADEGHLYLETQLSLSSLQAPAAVAASRRTEDKFGILFAASEASAAFASSGGEPIAILFIDIDDFKLLNTRFTETRVDKGVLGPFQELLRDTVGTRGIPCRQGGEEFIVVLPNHDLEEARLLAERFRLRVEREPFDVEGTPVKLTVSVGVADRRVDRPDFAAVSQAANDAEKQAKAQGKNRVVCAPD